jgi:hypothetical protein
LKVKPKKTKRAKKGGDANGSESEEEKPVKKQTVAQKKKSRLSGGVTKYAETRKSNGLDLGESSE